MKKLALAATAATALVAAAAPTSALGADKLIATDTHISHVDVLGKTVVYTRSVGRARLKRRTMIYLDGKVRRVRHTPKGTFAGQLGRDRRGRLVLTLVRATHKGEQTHFKWWIYDVRSKRSRRVRGLPDTCRVDALAVWRGRFAYRGLCAGDKTESLYVRKGKETQRATGYYADQFSLRGGSLAAILEVGDDHTVWSLMSGGEICRREAEEGHGEPISKGPLTVGLARGRLVWVMQDSPTADENVVYQVMTARPGADCGPFGATTTYPFEPVVRPRAGIAADGPWVVYSNGSKVYRHRLPPLPD